MVVQIAEGLGVRSILHAGVIFTDASRATGRVIHTDEALIIARMVCRGFGLG